MPFLTNENAYFNGILHESLIISTVGTIDNLIVWEGVSAVDRLRITQLIDSYGGDAPTLAGGPYAGRHVVNMDGSISAGTDLTGLDINRVYTSNVNIDGSDYNLSIDGSLLNDFDDLIAEINGVIGGNGVATITSGNILITSSTTGVGSTVTISPGDLFNHLNGFVTIQSTTLPGATTFLDVWRLNVIPGLGRTFEETYVYMVRATGLKPNFTTSDTTVAYWDGTDWRRMIDDVIVP